jgi:hypothetical protein
MIYIGIIGYMGSRNSLKRCHFETIFWSSLWNSYLQIKAKMTKKEVQNMTPK